MSGEGEIIIFSLGIMLYIHERNDGGYNLLQTISMNHTLTSISVTESGEEFFMGDTDGDIGYYRRNSSGLFDKIQDIS